MLPLSTAVRNPMVVQYCNAGGLAWSQLQRRRRGRHPEGCGPKWRGG
jgi:hypothetical protein